MTSNSEQMDYEEDEQTLEEKKREMIDHILGTSESLLKSEEEFQERHGVYETDSDYPLLGKNYAEENGFSEEEMKECAIQAIIEIIKDDEDEIGISPEKWSSLEQIIDTFNLSSSEIMESTISKITKEDYDDLVYDLQTKFLYGNNRNI